LRAVPAWLEALPSWLRWTVVAGLVVLLGLAAAAAVWTYLDRREAGARRDLVGVTATYRQSMTSRQEAALKAAAETLNRFLKDQPRSRVAMQAWYFLGNVESQRRNPDTALAAYEQAMRGSDGTITRLSRLGSAYAWEAKGDLPRALDAYTGALDGLGPSHFLYAELLLGKARSQERLGRRAEAVETYRKLVGEVPGFPRAEEVRMRLALLAGGG
jgi:tetratricopeptide (TPR) repeat protein